MIRYNHGKESIMRTHCTSELLPFQASIQWKIVARFNGGAIGSDATNLLLRQVEKVT